MSEPGYTLDASALLALLRSEPGAERVAEILPLARLGAVNLSEVVAKLVDYGIPIDAVAALEIETVPFERELAARAGELRKDTRKLGLSLGDRACLATAEKTNSVAVTADRTWSGLSLGIAIEVIR